MQLPLPVLTVLLSCISYSLAKHSELKKACRKLKTIHEDIDKDYPRPNGCIMQFTTDRGTCCAIGFRKVHKLIFHETFVRDKTCFKLRCKYLKGKKKKRWAKCGCTSKKIKLERPKTSPKPTTRIITHHTTRKPTTTRRTTTPPPPGCLYNGVLYPYGSDIPEMTGQSGNWCYGGYCSDSGEIIHWDNFNCGTTTVGSPPSTSPPPTKPPTSPPSPPPTTPLPPPSTTKRLTTTPPPPPGCVYNGILYPNGSEISEMSGQSGNWCYGGYCSNSGEIIHWDNFNCGTTTSPPPPTTPPPPPPTTRRKTTTSPPKTTTPNGCYVDGKHYNEGEDIPYYYGKSGDWCYGKICGPGGALIAWDNWDCGNTTPKQTTTASKPIPQRGCLVLGKLYKVGEDIPELFKKEGNYCVTYYCNEKEELEKWEDFNCGGTTVLELLATTPPMRLATGPAEG